MNPQDQRIGRKVYAVGGGNSNQVTEGWFKAVLAAVLPNRLTVRRIGDIRRSAEQALSDDQFTVLARDAAPTTHEPSRTDTVIELRRSRDGTTSSRIVTNAAERFATIRHLGHDPSDLVLTNCVVWVEGPSDRIYLTTWLRQRHELTEGIDYTVAFFGGALGARIGIEQDPDDRTFAEIRELCRRCVMLADSDRDEPDTPLKPHVRRWQESVADDGDALVMVTDGREIENSAPLDAISSARQHFGVDKISPSSHRFGRAVPAPPKKVDKVRFAEHMIANSAEEPTEQAREWLDEIAEFIRASRNGT